MEIDTDTRGVEFELFLHAEDVNERVRREGQYWPVGVLYESDGPRLPVVCRFPKDQEGRELFADIAKAVNNCFDHGRMYAEFETLPGTGKLLSLWVEGAWVGESPGKLKLGQLEEWPGADFERWFAHSSPINDRVDWTEAGFIRWYVGGAFSQISHIVVPAAHEERLKAMFSEIASDEERWRDVDMEVVVPGQDLKILFGNSGLGER